VSWRLTAGSLRTLRASLDYRLSRPGESVRVLQDLSRLRRWALRLSLWWRLSLLLLGVGLVRLGSLLSLQDSGLLGRLGANGLVWELGTNLLLLSWWSLLGLRHLVLLLLRALQDLGRKLAWHATLVTRHTTRHSLEWWLAMRELLLLLVVLRGRVTWEARG
jgi:hypothetical protein